MKKKSASFLLALMFFLTSCTVGEANENISAPQITETFPDITEFFETTPENTPDESEKTPSPEAPAAPVTGSPETSAEQTPRSERKLPLSIYDSPAEPYDDITPAKYTVIDSACFPDYGPENLGTRFPSDDKEAEEAALRAYKESDYYREALEETKEQELARYENGELVLADEMWKTVFGGFGNYIDRSAAPELDLKAIIEGSAKAKFDGKTEESIFFISFALPDSRLVSSGERANVAVPVYVNSAGEAFILDSAGYQGEISVSFIQYEKNGKIHIISNGCHSDATARTAVFSFENGQPKEELYTHGTIFEMEENGRVFRWQISCACSSFIFYSDEISRYCGIKSVPPSEKAAEAICSDKSLLEMEPDIRERYETGQLSILGGKYVVVYDNSYEYNGNVFAPTEGCRYDIPVVIWEGSPFEEYTFNVPIDEPPLK